MWNVYEVSKEIFANISKEMKGPKNVQNFFCSRGRSHESNGGESSNHDKLVQNNLRASFD